MIKHLESLKSKLYLEKYSDSRMAQIALEDPETFKEYDMTPDNILWRYSMVCVSEHHARLLCKFYKDMRKGCIEELGGVYFENNKPDYLVEGEEPTEEEYGFHGHYLFNIKEGTFDISATLQHFITTHAAVELAKSKAFRSYFPTVPIVKVKDGEAIPASNKDLEHNALARSYPLQDFFIDEYPKCLMRIKEICATKGDVSEIIRIIDGNPS